MRPRLYLLLLSLFACGRHPEPDFAAEKEERLERVLIKLERHLDAEQKRRDDENEQQMGWIWDTPDLFNSAFSHFVVFNEKGFKGCMARHALTDTTREREIMPMQLLLINIREMLTARAAYNAKSDLDRVIAHAWAFVSGDSIGAGAYGLASVLVTSQALILSGETVTRRVYDEERAKLPAIDDYDAEWRLRLYAFIIFDRHASTFFECGIAPDMRGLTVSTSDQFSQLKVKENKVILIYPRMLESVTIPYKVLKAGRE